MTDRDEARRELVQAYELASAECDHALDALTAVKGVKRIRTTLQKLRTELDEKAKRARRIE